MTQVLQKRKPCGPKKGSRNWRYVPLDPGTMYGEWTVLSEVPRVGPQRYAYCTCSCGKFQAVNLQSLRDGRSTRCMRCGNQAARNSQYIHGLAGRDRQTREYKIWMSTRQGAKERGLEHTIRPHDIVIPEFCPVLGIKLRECKGDGVGFKDDLASLDRIDSSLGYVPGNVRIISWRANRLKSDNTVETLEAILAYMKANLPEEK